MSLTPMDHDSILPMTEELQKVLLSTDFLPRNSKDEKDEIPNEMDVCSLDDQSFDKWVPSLRQAIDENLMSILVEELLNSAEENFQSLETQILQDSQINDNLTTSIKEIDLIQSLIKDSLQNDISNIQEKLTSTTNDLILKKQLSINNKKTSMKISESIILINKILQILELTNKCRDLIKDGNFFKALQHLDNLENIYLQDFKNYNFEFLKQIYNYIPSLKSLIKDESINLIKKSFSSNLEKTLSLMGHTYFDVYHDKLLPKWLQLQKSMKLPDIKFNSPVEISLRDEQTMNILQVSNFCKMDEFYDSIMIFHTLKEPDYLCHEFNNEYNFRISKLIYPLELKTSSNSSKVVRETFQSNPFDSNLNLSFLKEYMLKILGFLIYDKYLHNSTDYFFAYNSYNTTDEFWELLMSKLTPSLAALIKTKLSKDDEMIEFKDFLGIFLSIIENLKLNTEPLYKIHVSLFEEYSKLLISVFKNEFITLLNDDDFMPLVIDDKALYYKVLKICWMENDDSYIIKQDENFVATLPFSPLYPMACTLAKKTYNKLIIFITNFYQHDLTRLNLILVKTIDDIFQDVINANIKDKLDTTSREEIAQILINLDYFIVAAQEFSVIMTKENILHDSDIEIRLSSVKLLVETRKYAETKLIELIDSKVSDLIEFVELDWKTTEIRDEPDLSITDIAQFLEMMFTSTLVNLPYSVKTLLIFREFDSLTRRLLDHLLNETPPMITPQSICNFELDINFLQGVITKIFPHEPIDSFPELSPPLESQSLNGDSSIRSSHLIENNVKSLLSTFTDLNQHITLLKSGDLDEYKDSSIRMRKYPRIKPEIAHLLLSKINLSNSDSLSELESLSSHQDQGFPTNGRLAKLFNRGT